MDALKRIQIIQILKKMEKNLEFSKKLGIKDKSHFRTEKRDKGKRDPFL